MDDLSEKEQIELMRGWWQENGTFVVAGIVLGVGAIVGINLWQGGRFDDRVAASTRFEALAEEVAENRLDEAERIAATLYSEYADTIYADQARLAMARLYMDQGRDQDAAAELRALVEGDGNAQMQLLARLRLAKVLLYQGRADEVPPLLEGHDASGFEPRFMETLGDAHYALGDHDAAREAYLAALAGDGAGQLIDTNLVQMKLADLPQTSGAVPTGNADAVGSDQSVPEPPDRDTDEAVPADDTADPAADSGTDAAALPAAPESSVEPAADAGDAAVDASAEDASAADDPAEEETPQ